jgi:hypothetical protein
MDACEGRVTFVSPGPWIDRLPVYSSRVKRYPKLQDLNPWPIAGRCRLRERRL